MSCKYFEAGDTRQAEMRHDEPAEANALVETLFQQLPGSWNLRRRLQSSNASEPAGHCTGTATFTSREPSVFIDKDSKLDLAIAEMVYHEQGYFEMRQVSHMPDSRRFPFSRKYVWRLQQQDAQPSAALSIWFTKPGTEEIDYLFHKVNMTVDRPTGDEDVSKLTLHGNGGHLCDEDLYGSEYDFEFTVNGDQHMSLEAWEALHEVSGPQKDQLIQTSFARAEHDSLHGV